MLFITHFPIFHILLLRFSIPAFLTQKEYPEHKMSENNNGKVANFQCCSPSFFGEVMFGLEKHVKVTKVAHQFGPCTFSSDINIFHTGR